MEEVDWEDLKEDVMAVEAKAEEVTAEDDLEIDLNSMNYIECHHNNFQFVALRMLYLLLAICDMSVVYNTLYHR